MQKVFLAKIFPIGVVLLLALVAVKSLLQPGLPPTHDGEYHIIRFYEFDKALRSGQWYPRWAPDLNNGYGIPLFNYVYPLPNYMSTFFHLFGISFIDCFKLNMLVATLVGAVGMYLWAKVYWGHWGGLVSAAFYTYAPYHFLDIYIRGSVGEVWALALFLGFLWALSKLAREKSKFYVIIASVFFAAIIFSHNILALMFFPFALSYMIFLLYSHKKSFSLLYTLASPFFLGVGLAAIFWVPAIFERGYVTGLQIYNVLEHFPQVYQLIFPSWGSGFSSSDLGRQMSFQIGIANLLAVVGSMLAIYWVWKKSEQSVKTMYFFLIWFCIIFYMMLRQSTIVWASLPFLNYFQFPWRFLSLAILTTSFLAGGISMIPKSWIFAILAICFTILLNIGYTEPAYYLVRDDAYYITRPNFIDGTNTPGNIFNTIWMRRDLERKNEKFQVGSGIGQITVVSKQSTRYMLNVVVLEKQAEITANIAYFPGWQAFVDGSKVKTSVDKDGLFRFIVPAGKHRVEVRLIDTPVRSTAKALTVLSFLLLAVLLLKDLRARMGK